MSRLLSLVGLLAVLTAVAAAAPADADKEKKALQEVGDLVGTWKANGESKAAGKAALWKETLTVGWKFKDGAGWLAVESADGKLFSTGELRFDPAKKVYRLTATPKEGKAQVYEGPLAKGKLVLDRKDAASGDVTRLTIYTLADGARMVLTQEVQSKGKGLFASAAKLAANKDGESFAGGGNKKVCIVTGGLGTMEVSFGGKTYYVCCSGCRDEFNADPKKYVALADKK